MEDQIDSVEKYVMFTIFHFSFIHQGVEIDKRKNLFTL